MEYGRSCEVKLGGEPKPSPLTRRSGRHASPVCRERTNGRGRGDGTMGMGEQNETTDGCRSPLQAFYDAAFVSIFSAVRPSVHARFAPFTVAWGASERERAVRKVRKYANNASSGFGAAAINIFERDDSGRRRMSETAQRFQFSVAASGEGGRRGETGEERKCLVIAKKSKVVKGPCLNIMDFCLS